MNNQIGEHHDVTAHCVICDSPSASGNPKLCDTCWELNQRFEAVKLYNQEAAIKWLKKKLDENHEN